MLGSAPLVRYHHYKESSNVRIAALSIALTVALATGCTAAVPAQAASSGPERARVGTDVSGEITSTARVNYNDGSRSRLYALDIPAGKVMALELGGPLRGAISVFKDDQLVASSKERQLTYQSQTGGAHVVSVHSEDAEAYGPFQLSIKQVETWTGGELTPGRIADWLPPRDEKRYTLRITDADWYVIDLRSDDFDAMLSLEGQGVSLNNDDGGEGLNARLRTELQPGQYTLTASGYGRDGGLLDLEVARWSPPDGVEIRNSGALPPDGARIMGLASGTPNSYQMQVAQRSLVRIDMTSDDFDSVLQISGNGVSQEDDDGGEGLNARLMVMLEPGTYTVRASGYGNSGGLYELATRTEQVPEGGGSLAMDEWREAVLLPGARDHYDIEVREAGTYVFEMNSPDGIDGMFQLLRDGREIAEDDDSGSGLNPRLELRLEPGRYVLVARAYSSNDVGRYSVIVRRR